MRHRPTELREVVKILESEHDDVEQLAQEILDLLTEIKWKRKPWIAIRRYRVGGQGIIPDLAAYGPYRTRGEAERDIGRRITACSPGEFAYFAQVEDLDVKPGPDPDAWEESQ